MKAILLSFNSVESCDIKNNLVRVNFNVLYRNPDGYVGIYELNSVIEVKNLLNDFPTKLFEVIRKDCLDNRDYNLKPEDVKMLWSVI